MDTPLRYSPISSASSSASSSPSRTPSPSRLPSLITFPPAPISPLPPSPVPHRSSLQDPTSPMHPSRTSPSPKGRRDPMRDPRTHSPSPRPHPSHRRTWWRTERANSPQPIRKSSPPQDPRKCSPPDCRDKCYPRSPPNRRQPRTHVHGGIRAVICITPSGFTLTNGCVSRVLDDGRWSVVSNAVLQSIRTMKVGKLIHTDRATYHRLRQMRDTLPETHRKKINFFKLDKPFQKHCDICKSDRCHRHWAVQGMSRVLSTPIEAIPHR